MHWMATNFHINYVRCHIYDFHVASISINTLRLLSWYRQDNVANSLYHILNFVFCHANLWYLNIFGRTTWQLIFNMRSVCELPHYRLFSRCFEHFLNCLVFYHGIFNLVHLPLNIWQLIFCMRTECELPHYMLPQYMAT